MKKSLLFMFLILTLTLFSNNISGAQSFQLVSPTETPHIVVDTLQSQLSAHPIITNTSSAPLNFKIALTPVKIVQGHTFAICDLNTCYAPQSQDYVTPDISLLGPGESSSGLINIYLYPDNTAGVTELDVKFFNVDNPDDFITFKVVFNVGPVGINEPMEFTLSFSDVMPNPANGKLIIKNINLNSGNGTLNILNIDGKIIDTKELKSSEEDYELNVSNYSNGNYFYQVLEDNKIVKSGKFIVSR